MLHFPQIKTKRILRNKNEVVENIERLIWSWLNFLAYNSRRQNIVRRKISCNVRQNRRGKQRINLKSLQVSFKADWKESLGSSSPPAKRKKKAKQGSFCYRCESFQGSETFFLGGCWFLKGLVFLDQVLDFVDRVLQSEMNSISSNIANASPRTITPNNVITSVSFNFRFILSAFLNQLNTRYEFLIQSLKPVSSWQSVPLCCPSIWYSIRALVLYILGLSIISVWKFLTSKRFKYSLLIHDWLNSFLGSSAIPQQQQHHEQTGRLREL